MMKHSYLNTKEHRPLVQLRFEDKSSAMLLSLSQSPTRGLIKKYECFIKSTVRAEGDALAKQLLILGHSAVRSTRTEGARALRRGESRNKRQLLVVYRLETEKDVRSTFGGLQLVGKGDNR